MQESSPFFTSSSVLVCRLLMTVILTVVRWYLINLICISLIISNIEHLSMCLLAVCLWDRRFWCGVEINREFLGYTCWGWKHRPEWVYLGRHYNARSLQLSLEELHHILVVVGISTEEAEEEGSQRKEENRGGTMGERVAKGDHPLLLLGGQGRLAQKNSHCVYWQFIVDLDEAVSVLWWRQKAGWSRLSGQCMREGYGSESTDNSIAIRQCWMLFDMNGFFFLLQD